MLRSYTLCFKYSLIFVGLIFCCRELYMADRDRTGRKQKITRAYSYSM